MVVAFSQVDNADEEARKALHALLNKKELKSTNFTVVRSPFLTIYQSVTHVQLQIEVSALMNVNVDELFVVAACLASRSKLRLKVQPFSDAVKIVSERNRDVR